MASIEIKIEKLIYGGEGLAHHNGSTVFVPFVLPQERVAARRVEQKKKFIRARVEKLLEPSPDRIPPRCPHFGDCGGCDFQHIPYAEQLDLKTEILRETLRRIGRVDWTGPIQIHRSPEWGYRNRAQWKVRSLADEPAGADETPKLGIGYFRANSTALCAVEDCAVLSPLLLKTLLAFREALAKGELPRELREIEAVTSEDAAGENARLLLTLTFARFPSRAAELAERVCSIVPEAESVLFHDPSHERMELFGPGSIECRVGEASYRVGHFSFFQVNRFLAEELATAVAEDGAGGRLALDLFAGVGLFSVPLSKHFERVVAVESNPAAVRDLESNIRGHKGIEVRSATVERFFEKFSGKPDLVVLDPPRAGMPRPALDKLLRLAPARIAYVSCEPPTLARDLQPMIAGGYEMTELHLFDLFPQTFHTEALARLRRRP